MKTIATISLMISVFAAGISIVCWQRSRSENEINRLVDARLEEKEMQLVARYKPNLEKIEKDLGVTPSNPVTLEEMGKAFARIILLPKQ